MEELTRCEWAGTDPLMVAYHDDDWGVPTHDDRALFELLTLEGAHGKVNALQIVSSALYAPLPFANLDARQIEWGKRAEITATSIEIQLTLAIMKTRPSAAAA